jgi:hypothetical protein
MPDPGEGGSDCSAAVQAPLRRPLWVPCLQHHEHGDQARRRNARGAHRRKRGGQGYYDGAGGAKDDAVGLRAGRQRAGQASKAFKESHTDLRESHTGTRERRTGYSDHILCPRGVTRHAHAVRDAQSEPVQPRTDAPWLPGCDEGGAAARPAGRHVQALLLRSQEDEGWLDPDKSNPGWTHMRPRTHRRTDGPRGTPAR